MRTMRVRIEERNSLCTDCKTKHEKVAIFADETVPRVHVITSCSLKESRER